MVSELKIRRKATRLNSLKFAVHRYKLEAVFQGGKKRLVFLGLANGDA